MWGVWLGVKKRERKRKGEIKKAHTLRPRYRPRHRGPTQRHEHRYQSCSSIHS